MSCDMHGAFSTALWFLLALASASRPQAFFFLFTFKDDVLSFCRGECTEVRPAGMVQIQQHTRRKVCLAVIPCLAKLERLYKLHSCKELWVFVIPWYPDHVKPNSFGHQRLPRGKWLGN